MVFLVMGVSGSGKTTIGQLLASELGWDFIDADDVHPRSNIAKMAAGEPLTDKDRAPWLAALRAKIDDHLIRGKSVVVTCSALKERYREVLVIDPDHVKVIHLHGSSELLRSRISGRKGHFMSASMLDSQLAALEPPEHAFKVDVAQTPKEIVALIRGNFRV